MFKPFNELAARAVAEFIVLAVIFGIIGHAIYTKVDEELTSAFEKSVALQAQSLAFGIEQQSKHEFDKLRIAAALIEQGKLPVEDLFETTLSDTEGETMGIITKDGRTIAGSPLSNESLSNLHSAFNGVEVVKYRQNIGLTFAVPIKVEGESCVLYANFDDDAIRRKFQALSYNGAGTLYIHNGMDNWLLLSKGWYFFSPSYMREGWYKLGDKFNANDHKPTAMYYDYNGQGYFLHFSEISVANHFALTGYVPWEYVAVGIDYIYVAMIISFFVVLVLLIFAVRYMMTRREAKALEQQKILADSANKAKSEFLSNMSHEIRTPINAIMGMNEMVIREAKDSSIIEYSENLKNAARTLLGLVNDILDFSKIEAGKMEIIPVEYHISSILNDLINMIQTRAEKKGLDFRINVSPTIPSVLFGDEIRIKQVITNILTNAVKYTEEGGVTLNVTSRRIDDAQIYLCVSVSDTGIGIKQEDIKKLFSAFERIEEKRNRTIEGTGLGMNITQRLLALMNSKLHVESTYGKGSTFAFQVEQRVINSEPIGNFQQDYKSSLNQHKEYHESFIAPNATILVVDDTVMNLTVVKGLLKQTKIKIETALNGEECLKMVTHKKYDIIFLDHRMPGMDGIETLQAMEEMSDNLNKETPVISLTANAISGAREQYIAAGFQDYLTKPINSAQLEKMVIKYLPPEKVLTSESSNTAEVAEVTLPEWLTKVEGININEGVNHCGSEEAYIDALTVFANAINTAAAEIEKYFNTDDWKNYTTKVHALKSSSKVIGADELSERARRLEDAGNSGYIEEIKQDNEPLLKLYRSYTDKLKPLIQVEEDDSDKPLIDEAELAEAFEAMKDAAATFDYDSLMFVFQSLDEYRLPEGESERYKQIKDAAAKLDWETINSILKDGK